MSEIIQYPDKPNIFEIDGVGRIEYLEWERDIWIQDVFSERRGYGVKLIRGFIRYAKKANKNVWGGAKPVKHHTMLTPERLKRWYHYFGAEDVPSDEYPTAMRLRIRK